MLFSSLSENLGDPLLLRMPLMEFPFLTFSSVASGVSVGVEELLITTSFRALSSAAMASDSGDFF